MTPSVRKALGAILFVLGLILHYAPFPAAGWQLALPVLLIGAGFFLGYLRHRVKVRATA